MPAPESGAGMKRVVLTKPIRGIAFVPRNNEMLFLVVAELQNVRIFKMNGIEILLKAVDDGALLGPNTFANLEPEDVDEILNARDRPAFEVEWLRAAEQMDAVNLSETEAAGLLHLREKTFRTTDRAFSDVSEASGYISDDFELIGKAIAGHRENEFLAGLLEGYLKGQIPHTVIVPSPGVTLRSMVERLRQTQ